MVAMAFRMIALASQNQNLFYCQVGFHIQGIGLGVLVHNNKHSKKTV